MPTRGLKSLVRGSSQASTVLLWEPIYHMFHHRVKREEGLTNFRERPLRFPSGKLRHFQQFLLLPDGLIFPSLPCFPGQSVFHEASLVR